MEGYQTEPTTLEVTTGETTEFVEEAKVENERTVEDTVENFDEPEADELEFTEDKAAESKAKRIEASPNASSSLLVSHRVRTRPKAARRSSRKTSENPRV
jgi:hypothetical protein